MKPTEARFTKYLTLMIPYLSHRICNYMFLLEEESVSYRFLYVDIFWDYNWNIETKMHTVIFGQKSELHTSKSK